MERGSLRKSDTIGEVDNMSMDMLKKHLELHGKEYYEKVADLRRINEIMREKAELQRKIEALEKEENAIWNKYDGMIEI